MTYEVRLLVTVRVDAHSPQEAERKAWDARYYLKQKGTVTAAQVTRALKPEER